MSTVVSRKTLPLMRFLAVEFEIGPQARLRISHQLKKRRTRLFPTLVSTRDLSKKFTNHSVDRGPIFRRDDPSPFKDLVLDRQRDIPHSQSPQLHITCVTDWSYEVHS